MAAPLLPEAQITYGQLKLQVLNWIISTCQNIDTWRGTEGTQSGYNSGEFNTIITTDADAKYFKAQWQLSDTMCTVVTRATVMSEFNSFCVARGISQKEDQTVTTKGILNFFNNISAFLNDKVRVVSFPVNSISSSTPTIIYVNKEVEADIVPNVDSDDEVITTKDTKSMLSILTANMGTKNKTSPNPYTITYSSCSSSSSSSCSCSSSSSIFIAYFKI